MHGSTTGGAILGTGARYLVGIGARKEKAEPSPVPAKAAFYSPDFFAAESRPWLEYETDLWLTRDELLRSLAPFAAPEALPRLTWMPADREDFNASFDDLQIRIRDGILTQSGAGGFPRPRASARSGSIARSGSSARFSTPSAFRSASTEAGTRAGGMMGATPEDALRIRLPAPHFDDGARRHPAAGTPDREGWARLLRGLRKERREHQIVVDNGISQAPSRELGRAARIGDTGGAGPAGPFASADPTIHCADSKTRCRSFARMALALHPTPALGAFPREEGWGGCARQDRGRGDQARALRRAVRCPCGRPRPVRWSR